MALFRWLFSTFIAIAVVIFAISNMQDASVNISPFHPPLTYPLAVIVGIALAAGFLGGGFFVWLQQGPLSKKAFKKRFEHDKVKKELKALKEKPPLPNTPLLGSK